MRKILAILLFAALASTCYIGTQEDSGTDNSGQETPRERDVSDITAYGIFPLSCEDVAYTPGRDQISIIKVGDKVSFRIIDPAEVEMVEFGGIPALAVPDDVFNLEIKISSKGQLISGSTVKVTVKKVEDPRLWLRAEDGTYYIVRR